MSVAATETLAPVQLPTRERRTWETFGNYVVLLVYSGIVLFTVRYHEKWADEAQAWLVARDLDLKTLWFHELRYEGSPVSGTPFCGLRSECFTRATIRSVISAWRSPSPA